MQEASPMTGGRIAVPLAVAVALAIATLTLAPRAFEAGLLLSSQDDPVALADHAIARSFDATVAAREIEDALAVNDADLAKSFLDLARDRNVPVDAALAAKVDTANAAAATAARSVESFTRGLITGEPEDLSGLAGTALGDLFVFGDIRDAVREGTRFATGQQADELILGLACVGLAITAGTYATLGAAVPARVGMTVVKAARKTGRIGGQMAAWINRSVREVIDWTSLSSALRGASITQPAAAVRAAREAVKVEKARDLVRLVGDVGRVQTRAGTQAALDGLKLAEGPRDMSRVARLAAAKGGKTRAVLKLAGRGAIVLTVGAFNLANWMLWALVTAFGLVSALKRMTERSTERYCARRRRARANARCANFKCANFKCANRPDGASANKVRYRRPQQRRRSLLSPRRPWCRNAAPRLRNRSYAPPSRFLARRALAPGTHSLPSLRVTIPATSLRAIGTTCSAFPMTASTLLFSTKGRATRWCWCTALPRRRKSTGSIPAGRQH